MSSSGDDEATIGLSFPRRPPSAYESFFNDMKAHIIAQRSRSAIAACEERQQDAEAGAVTVSISSSEDSDVSLETMNQTISETWDEISPQERARYEIEANGRAQKYQAEVAEYTSKLVSMYQRANYNVQTHQSSTGMTDYLAASNVQTHHGYLQQQEDDDDDRKPAAASVTAIPPPMHGLRIPPPQQHPPSQALGVSRVGGGGHHQDPQQGRATRKQALDALSALHQDRYGSSHSSQEEKARYKRGEPPDDEAEPSPKRPRGIDSSGISALLPRAAQETSPGRQTGLLVLPQHQNQPSSTADSRVPTSSGIASLVQKATAQWGKADLPLPPTSSPSHTTATTTAPTIASTAAVAAAYNHSDEGLQNALLGILAQQLNVGGGSLLPSPLPPPPATHLSSMDGNAPSGLLRHIASTTRQQGQQPSIAAALQLPSLSTNALLLHQALYHQQDLLASLHQGAQAGSSLQPAAASLPRSQQSSSSASTTTSAAAAAPPPPISRPAVHDPKVFRSINVSLPSDKDSLSEYQCILREQLCFFEAAKCDLEASAQGRNKAINLRQCGIRCRHCSHVLAHERGPGAVYFPAKLNAIYQASQNIYSNHLKEVCNHIPNVTRKKLQGLKSKSLVVVRGSKQYWASSAGTAGLIEVGEDGLYFLPHVKSTCTRRTSNDTYTGPSTEG